MKYRPRIRSRHPSHNVLRRILPKVEKTVVVRFGSTTISNANIEVNTIEAVKNSSDKLKMKNKFLEADVRTPIWFTFYKNYNFFNCITKEIVNFENMPFPIIAKRRFGSRNNGNEKIDNATDLNSFLNKHSGELNNFIFERFYNFNKEYRLHVTKDGVFYSCRKMIKNNTPDEHKWFKNNLNCVWILEKNELFDKPDNWDYIVNESVKALNAVGLDFGAVDVRVQSNNKFPAFVIIEINSAPSFGEITAEKYKEILPKIINKKINENYQ